MYNIELINKLIDNGTLIVGTVEETDGGYKIFRRDDKISISSDNIGRIAFATKSMGRAIFQFDEEGRIQNFKGVDSQLKDEENQMISNVNADTFNYEINEEGLYQLNLIIFPGNRPEIRFRGASPLEDLEEDAEVNKKMHCVEDKNGRKLKLPEITEIREFTQDFLMMMNLPQFVEGKMDEYFRPHRPHYKEEDDERKKFLREEYQKHYIEAVPEGFRPSSMQEYFFGTGLTQNEKLQSFVQDITGELQRRCSNDSRSPEELIKKFASAVDSYYERGQRYGQAKRIIQNPFRISDIENIINEKGITRKEKAKKIELIARFSEIQQEGNESFEEYFAKQMGNNVATMINTGWRCNNFIHRQDFSLAGELCDDSFYDGNEKINNYSMWAEEIEKQCDEQWKNINDKYGEVFEIHSIDEDEFLTDVQHLNIQGENDEKDGEIVGKLSIKYQLPKNILTDIIRDIDKVDSLDGEYGEIFNEIENIKKEGISSIFMLASNMKVLQDEMKIRGKSNEEIDSILLLFVKTASEGIEEEKRKELLDAIKKIQDSFSKDDGVIKNWPQYMACKLRNGEPITENGVPKIDEEIINGHPNEYIEFYDLFSANLTQSLQRGLIRTPDLGKQSIKEQSDTSFINSLEEEKKRQEREIESQGVDDKYNNDKNNR